MAIFKRRSSRNKNNNKTEYITPYDVTTWQMRGTAQDILQVDLVRACIDFIAKQAAKMALSAVMERNGKTEPDYTSDVSRVLAKPNRYMTQYDFLYKVVSQLYYNSNSFIWPEYDEAGNLTALWPISYQYMELFRKDGVLIARFRLRYTQEYTVPYDRIIHLRAQWMKDDFFGDDTTISTAPMLELLRAEDSGIINGIRNSATIRGLLKAAGVIKDSDLEKARQRFIKDNFSLQNSGGVGVLDAKYDYIQLHQDQYTISKDVTDLAKSKVFSYYHVSEKLLSGAFSAEEYEAFYESTLEPLAIQIGQTFTQKLYTDRERGFGNRVEISLSKLAYQPMSTVINLINSTSQLGLFTRNEYRAMLGYSPLTDSQGGNAIMIAVNNYAPAGTDTGSDTADSSKNEEDQPENEEQKQEN